MTDQRVHDAIGRWERNEPADGDSGILVETARLVANAETVQLCGENGNYRKGKPLNLSCIYGAGHFPSCGRYRLVAALTPRDTDE